MLNDLRFRLRALFRRRAVETSLQDVRYDPRVLSRNPGSSIIAALMEEPGFLLKTRGS